MKLEPCQIIFLGSNKVGSTLLALGISYRYMMIMFLASNCVRA